MGVDGIKHANYQHNFKICGTIFLVYTCTRDLIPKTIENITFEMAVGTIS